MFDAILKIKPELEKVIERFKNDLAGLRTGRATPALVENIMVDYYGSRVSLKEIAAISVPEPKQLVITPWDKNAVSDMEKGIRNSDLGINPIVDGHLIRLNMPPMTDEYRKKLIKLVKEKAEEARVAVRGVRDDCWKEIQALEREKKIREDEKFKGKDDLQKLIDETHKKIEELSQKKEEEIQTV